MSPDPRPLRAAVIGCGFFAQNHLHAWRELPGVEVAAVCDVVPERAHAAAVNFGGRAYLDAAELLARERVDFVDIATTAPTHRPLVELAARHGAAVICQKPLAWDMADAEAMVQACREQRLPFMVHENFRFQHPMRELRRVLDAGAIGRPFFGRIGFRTAHDVYRNQPWLMDSERMIIIDVAVHLLDLARFFLGEPRSVYAHTLQVNPRIRGEDVATIVLGLDGATCVVDASYETRSDHDTYPQTFVTIEGTEGTVRLDADYRLQVVSRGRVEERTLEVPTHSWASTPWNGIQDSVHAIQRHWLDCLRTGRTPETSGEDTLRLLRLAFASYRSADRAEAVHLDGGDGAAPGTLSPRSTQ